MAGLPIKFLDIFGDYYHLVPPSGGGGGGGQLMAISSLLDFNKNFKVPTGREDAVKDVFTKDFGVPYIYGPSLAMQEKRCKPANYADVADLLKNRVSTLDDQIKQTKSLGNTGSIYMRRLEKIKKSIEDYVAEMDANKGGLPICDDYKVAPLADGSEEMLNYLTRALYYGLKPAAATDEIRRCVNLFKDPKSIDAELTALLEIVKQKKKDELLSFLKQISVSVAALSDKIKADRAAAGGSTPRSPGSSSATAVTPFDEKAFRDALIDFFNKMSKSDLGTKSFTGAGDLFAEYKAAISGLKIDTIDHTGMDIAGLTNTINGMLGDAKIATPTDASKVKLLEDILGVINGTASSATITGAADKLAAFDALKGLNILAFVDAYINYIVSYATSISEDNISDNIKAFEKLFSILYELKLINDNTPISPEQRRKLQDNIKNISSNSTFEEGGRIYTIDRYIYYESEFLKYGFIQSYEELTAPAPGVATPIKYGPSKKLYDSIDNIKASTTGAPSPTIYNELQEIKDLTIGSKITFTGKSYTLRDIIATPVELILICKDDSGNYITITGKDIESGKVSPSITPGKPEDGREAGIGGTLTETSRGIGATTTAAAAADPTEVARLTTRISELEGKLATANAVLDPIIANRDISKTKVIDLEGQLARVKEALEAARGGVGAPTAADMALAEAQIADLSKQLDEARRAGAATVGPTDPGAGARVADLEAQLADAREQLAAVTASLATRPTSGAMMGLKQEVANQRVELARIIAERDAQTTALTDAQTRTHDIEVRLEAATVERDRLVTQLAVESGSIATLELERSALHETIMDQGGQLRAADEQVARLEAQIAALTRERDSLHTNVGNISTEAEALQTRIDTLTAELATAAASQEALQTNYKGVVATLDTLDAELATALESLERAETERDEARTESTTSTGHRGIEIAGLRRQVAEKVVEITTLQGDLRTSQAETARLSGELTALQGQVAERDTRITALEAGQLRLAMNLETTEAEKEALRVQEADLRSQNEAINMELTNLRTQMDAASTLSANEKAALESQIAKKTAQAESNEAEITLMAAQTNAILKRRKELESQLGAKTTEHSTAVQQLTEMRTQLQTVQQQKAENDSRIAEFTRQVGGLRSELAAAAAVTEATKQLESNLRQRNEALAQRIDKMNGERAELMRKGGDLERMIQGLQAEVDNRALQLDNLEGIIESKRATIEQLEEEEGELETKKTSLEKVVGDLQSAILRIADLEAQITGFEMESIILEDNLQKVKEALAAKDDELEAQLAAFAETRRALEAQIESGVSNREMLEELRGIRESLKGQVEDDVPEEKKTAQLLAEVNEQRQRVEEALRAEIAELKARAEELAAESQSQKAEIVALNKRIEDLQRQKSIQNFGMLTSFMVSNPAFRGAALLSMATVPEGKRSVLNTNAGNIQRMIPGLEGSPSEAVYRAYLDAMTDLEKVLLPANGANGSAVVGADNDIVTLANLVKLLSSPQVSGLYTLQDLRVSPGLLAALTSEGTLDDISVDEPSLSFIPPALRKTIEDRKFKIMGAKVGMDFEWKSGLVAAFFSKQENKTTDLIAMFPKVNAGAAVKSVVIDDTAAKPEYLNKVSLSLFEVRGNEVVAARYAESAARIREDKATHVTLADVRGIQVKEPPIFGEIQLIPRSAVTRLYLRSLKAALQTKWVATAEVTATTDE